jgi:ATP-dependent helicase/DNAse subunit B
MDPLERGTAIHSILESFFRDFGGETFLTESSEKLWASLELHARDILEKSRPAGLQDLLWEIERDALLAMLKQWLMFEKERAGEGMLVFKLERAFGELGPAEVYPAFRMKAGNRAFEFRGRIDRVDISRDGKRVRIVDYKTGTLPDSMAKDTRTPLMSGERIQIAVYKGALSVMNEFQNVQNVEGEYLHLQPKDARIVPCPYTNDELQAASKALPDVLEVLGDGIESGVFFARAKGMVRPYGHCDFCDYLHICGKDRIQREERKMNDPAVRRFMAIQEMDR